MSNDAKVGGRKLVFFHKLQKCKASGLGAWVGEQASYRKRAVFGKLRTVRGNMDGVARLSWQWRAREGFEWRSDYTESEQE